MNKTIAMAVLAAALVSGCRGERSEEPPVHPIRNMFTQARFDPQEETDLFADKRTMRPIPAGTVARGSLRADDWMSYGKASDGGFARGFPMDVTAQMMERGHLKFNTYCQPCHGPLGLGDGMVSQRGYAGITSLQEQRIVDMPEGEIFNAISAGVRNMPAYNVQITEQDRWAIVAYLRALQRSQHAKLDDVPEAERAKLSKK